MVQEHQQLLTRSLGSTEHGLKRYSAAEREFADTALFQFVTFAQQGEFRPELVEGIDQGLLQEALSNFFLEELHELESIQQLFAIFKERNEAYTEHPETAASIAAVKMLDADGTIPHVLGEIGIPPQAVQWKTVYMPVQADIGRTSEPLTLLGGYDLLKQIRAKAFPPLYQSPRTAVAKLMQAAAGRPELFAQASMHQSLHKNAITGSTEFDGEIYSALYYQLSFAEPGDRETMALLWLLNRLPNEGALVRVRFTNAEGVETSNITEAVETGVFLHAESVQRNSPIHQGQRSLPRESVAIQINGKMMQVSLNGNDRFRSFAERQGYFARLNQASIRAVDAGEDRFFTPTEFLRESQERLTELISSPLTNMNKQSITRLRERLITMILHDAKYVMSGMIEQNEGVYRPEVFAGYQATIREAVQNLITIIDVQLEELMMETDDDLEGLAGQIRETKVSREELLKKVGRIRTGLNRWNSLRRSMLQGIREIEQSVELQGEIAQGTMNVETQAMATFLERPLLDLMEETSRFNGILSGYSLQEVIGSEAEAWQQALNRKNKKIAAIGSVSFDVDMPPDMPDIIGNGVFMAAALKNIFQNAVKRNRGASTIDFRIQVQPAPDVVYTIPDPQVATSLAETPLQWFRLSISNTGQKIELEKALAFNGGQQEYSQRADGTKSEGLALVREIVSEMNRADVVVTEQPFIVMRPFEDTSTNTQGTTIEILVLAAPASLSVPQLV